MNDNEPELDPVVYIVIGRVWENEEAAPQDAITIQALLTAADDDDAVRKTLESLSAQGYAEAELDQIGIMDGEPDDAIYEEAYQDALEGNVAIVTFTG
ncbi:regulator [Roseibium salinum]|uniref:Regulator n=1 Tax=Roseibium salinum TaxID=1604349 RepID=A0ABT3QZU3_9HYPH|nr:regulator [Roseibium sp. DSM 29163]MCX2722371.1 regulator [Roseibium sp. DSM 29163]MDN3719631.1 regulator [Roseibium salinum]